MRMSTIKCNQAQSLLNISSRRNNTRILSLKSPKDKVVVITGATGTGKSRLSIDLATHFPAEVVNSDKMQVYKGLDIVTNKITKEESRGVPHHLLGVIDPNADFTAMEFCNRASLAIKTIVNRWRLPIVVGGSNSFIEALVDNEDFHFRSRYDFLFLWVDVSMPVLCSAVAKRVDRMVEAGMVEEVRQLFKPSADYSRGIRRAIGVPEFDQYFQAKEESTRARLFQEAIQAIKDNTCRLACRQLEKIHRLKNVKGWKLHRLDATDVFRKHGKEADEAWEKLVARPSTNTVKQFLYDFSPEVIPGATAAIRTRTAIGTAMAAVTH